MRINNMHFRFNVLDLVNMRALRWSLMRNWRVIALVSKTRRGRSARLGLRILNILRPP